MKTNKSLAGRIQQLNDRGIPCNEIAVQAGVKTETVRRMRDGVSTRHVEKTYNDILRAVYVLERRPKPKGEALQVVERKDGTELYAYDHEAFVESLRIWGLGALMGLVVGCFIGYHGGIQAVIRNLEISIVTPDLQAGYHCSESDDVGDADVRGLDFTRTL